MSDVGDLIQGAANDGSLSAKSQTSLKNFPNLDAQIRQGLGIKPDEVATKDVTIVSVLIDDSGSIRFASMAGAVRQGHNAIVKSIMESKQEDNILMMTKYLNGHVLTPYVKVQDVPLMDSHNYDPNGSTPLYDQSVIFLASVMAKYKQFDDAGVPCRGISLIVTDGEDVSSEKSVAKDVKNIVKDLLKTEDHIVAAMGIGDEVAFWDKIFEDMGIPEDWRLTPSMSEHDIRSAFSLFSKSAVKASQSGAIISQIGGFN